jgi:diguanylate cyclase (GGDEF)-like protein
MLDFIEVCGMGGAAGPLYFAARAPGERRAAPPAQPKRNIPAHKATAFSFFPPRDAGQRLRLHRYLIAAGTSLMFVFLLTLCFLEGALTAGPFATAASATLLAIVGFYAAFRTGLNKRARDRSLTVPMMLTACAVVTFVLFHVGPARPVFLLMYPVILFFGVFRLNTRKLLNVTAVALLGYALVIALLVQTPAAIGRPHIEVLQWFVLAAVLVWFSFMGGYVHQLHGRLRESEHDELTGIYTRRRILEVLEHERIRCERGAGPLSIGMIDIDRFKSVNDSFGHAVGDDVLRKSVDVAHAELRAIDFMGRYGGEEFLVVLTQTKLEGAQECVERVRARTERTSFGLPGGRAVTLSIGVAQLQPGESIRDLLARADAALYRAKAAGRNRTELA